MANSLIDPLAHNINYDVQGKSIAALQDSEFRVQSYRQQITALGVLILSRDFVKPELKESNPFRNSEPDFMAVAIKTTDIQHMWQGLIRKLRHLRFQFIKIQLQIDQQKALLTPEGYLFLCEGDCAGYDEEFEEETAKDHGNEDIMAHGEEASEACNGQCIENHSEEPLAWQGISHPARMLVSIKARVT
ncbi:MAG: hypothetical protein Q9220_005753 [cf. Caloplaca sp. 1 TL-2023]